MRALMTWSRRVVVLALLTLLANAGGVGAVADGAGPAVTDGPADTMRLALLIEDEDPDRFASAFRAGAEQAADDRGLTLGYHVLPTARGQRQAMLGTIISARPDGLAIAVRDPVHIRDEVVRLGAGDTPFVFVRFGRENWRAAGAIGFVGQSESVAGRIAGRGLADLGATNAICVLDEAALSTLDVRCQAAAAELEASGGHMEPLHALDAPGDPTGVRDAIIARLRLDPSIDAVLATEEHGLAAALEARRREGNDVSIATFDPDAATRRAITTGDVQFAIDQQPFLQGYLSVLALSLFIDHGLVLGEDGLEPTGPVVVLAS